ncbi:hypothetical protein K492DRAFT_211097 [Lichtheimia hyalospora FSU 10163]|nr:hypothetical protein K492DRAFT_211097 [Lichtheimia hyalospora FSU 10163]
MSNIEDTIATIELLQSMYCGDDEFSFCTTQDQDAYDRMLKAMEDGDNDKPVTTESIRLQLNLPLSSDQEDISSWRLAVTCRFSSDFDIAVASSHNNWLSRDAHQALTRSLQEFECDADDQPTRVLDSIQFLQSQAEDTAVKAYLEQQNNAKNNDKDSGPVTFLREWIWFPMIYTREKRGHIIDWAPGYGVTGFLCPGKPGALCMEGIDKNVQRFINDIKTVSWSDIPASHRKMSTKWQERHHCDSMQDLNRHRKFPDMTEVTFDLHGAFGNHNDLGMLQQWLKEKDCPDAFDHLFDHDS